VEWGTILQKEREVSEVLEALLMFVMVYPRIERLTATDLG
jgi:hypothetical protein